MILYKIKQIKKRLYFKNVCVIKNVNIYNLMTSNFLDLLVVWCPQVYFNGIFGEVSGELSDVDIYVFQVIGAEWSKLRSSSLWKTDS